MIICYNWAQNPGKAGYEREYSGDTTPEGIQNCAVASGSKFEAILRGIKKNKYCLNIFANQNSEVTMTPLFACYLLLPLANRPTCADTISPNRVICMVSPFSTSKDGLVAPRLPVSLLAGWRMAGMSPV
jgi:hypothetical protein